MKAFLNNTVLGLAVVIPLLLLVIGLVGLQAIPADLWSFPRLRRWLAGSSVVFVALFAVVVTARFVLR